MKSSLFFKIFSSKFNTSVFLISIHLFIMIIMILSIKILNDPTILPVEYFLIMPFLFITIPFLLFTLIIFDRVKFKYLLKQIWFKLVVLLITVLFVVLSNSFANQTLNDIYRLDSSHFPITKIVLSYYYPVNLITFSIEKILIFSMFILLFSLFLLFKQKYKKAALTFFIFIYFCFVSGFNYGISNNLNKIIQVIANKFDFNKHNICHNLDKNYLVGTIYLGNEKALISRMELIQGKEVLRYYVQDCFFERELNIELK